MKTIYKIKYGSQAYGTQTPESDVDIRGILLPTLEESLGLVEMKDTNSKGKVSKCCHEATYSVAPADDNVEGSIICTKCEKSCSLVDLDETMFTIQKFFKLALANNPSVLEWLFVPGRNCILEMTPEGKAIRDNRLLFLSKQIYVKFKGYAYSEYTRLTKLNGKTGEKRRNTVLELGYNGKSAMNIVRLLDQAIELLTTGTLTMPLKNAAELLRIKKGKLEYKQIMELYHAKELELEEALKASKLPEKSRFDDANYLMVNLIKNQ